MPCVDWVAHQPRGGTDALSAGEGGVRAIGVARRARAAEADGLPQAAYRAGAARQEPPQRRPDHAPAPIWPEVSGALGDLGVIALRPVDRRTAASETWHAMMTAHHPLGAGPLCGAQIRYLIISQRYGVVGGLAVSAAAWRLGARD